MSAAVLPWCGATGLRAPHHGDWTSGVRGGPRPGLAGQLFEGSDANPELRRLLAATIAAEQCRLLRAAGVEEFNFCMLNRAKLTLAICHILGIGAPLPARP